MEDNKTVNLKDAKTPMLIQYQEIKDANPGALIMFRLGDFYELFGDDAVVASRELDIVLTGRAAGLSEKIPMCGVPHHAIDSYLSQLVQKGYSVVVCEQLEDPKEAQGLVKRGVVRIITPGTAMEAGATTNDGNFIAAISVDPEYGYGFSYCETSTGELKMAEYTRLSDVSAEIMRINPSEILISESDYLSLSQESKTWILKNGESISLTTRPADLFDNAKSVERLEKQFSKKSSYASLWVRYPLAAVAAAGILFYLDKTQLSFPDQIISLSVDMTDKNLVMDPTTFRNLEISKNLRTFEKRGSLLDLLDKTNTACGSRLMKEWVEKPLIDKAAIEQRYDCIDRFVADYSKRKTIRENLRSIYDMERLMTRVVYKRATPNELLSLKDSLKILPKIKDVLQTIENTKLLDEILADFDVLSDVAEKLENAIAEEIPANWKDGGFINDGYSKEVDELKIAAKNGRQWLLDLELSEKEKTGIKNLKIGYNKVYGYYFDVSKGNLPLVPEYFHRKQTLTTGERFVTDELTNIEGMVLGSEEKLLAMEMELYRELLDFVGKNVRRVQITSKALAQIDVLISLSEVAVKNDYVRPELIDSSENRFMMKDLRHPVVETIMEDTRFVPNDLSMGNEDDLYIITGPNMGGKSTYCRSVALCFVMAQMGSFVPCSKAIISIRDRIFARVGASDDLRGGQSTFMMEMTEVANILTNATKNSFIVLDEVGRGTGTFDGLSVAWSVSEYIVNTIKAKTLFATHYLELTHMAEIFPTVKNMSLLVEEEGDNIIFLHKILPGSANKSYGIHVAQLAGIPDEVITRAREKLSELESDNKVINVIKEKEVIKEETPGYIGDQISLFGEVKNSEESFYEEIAREIKNKNLLRTSPLDALNYLFRLQEKIEKHHDN